MAKTTGPLFSLEASGTIGHTVTYSHWHGRPYARRRVIPLNPYAATQVAARNRVRTIAEGVHFSNKTALKYPAAASTDKVLMIAVTPTDLAWNSFLTQKAIGANFIDYAAAATLWGTFTGGQKTAWDDAAAALVPAIKSVSQGNTGGGYTTAMTAGQVFLHYVYGVAIVLGRALPTSTPPAYA